MEAWAERFAEREFCDPQWDDDVYANLERHRERLRWLSEEMEKEEFFIEYVEQVISDSYNGEDKRTSGQAPYIERLQTGDGSSSMGSCDFDCASSAADLLDTSDELDDLPPPPPPPPLPPPELMDNTSLLEYTTPLKRTSRGGLPPLAHSRHKRTTVCDFSRHLV